MIRTILVLLTISPSIVFSQNLTGARELTRHSIDGKPNFFFKVNDSGSLVSFSRSQEGDNRGVNLGTNHILDTKDGEEFKIPGNYDPVFFPLSKLMIFRNSTEREAQYKIYKISELLKGIETPISSVENLTGYYQSTGLLKSAKNAHYYRAIAENHNQSHLIVDFSYDLIADKITYQNSDSFNLLCPKVKIKLPMLSKDGSMLGGIDLKTQTSAVWKINDDYSCNKVLDLGIRTGKLNFNYTGDKLTYHLYRKVSAGRVWDDQSQDYVGIPDNTFTSDIFVYDLKTNSVAKLTSNYADNSMYPDFTRDGRIVFINHPHNREEASSFIFVNQKRN